MGFGREVDRDPLDTEFDDGSWEPVTMEEAPVPEDYGEDPQCKSVQFIDMVYEKVASQFPVLHALVAVTPEKYGHVLRAMITKKGDPDEIHDAYIAEKRRAMIYGGALSMLINRGDTLADAMYVAAGISHMDRPGVRQAASVFVWCQIHLFSIWETMTTPANSPQVTADAVMMQASLYSGNGPCTADRIFQAFCKMHADSQQAWLRGYNRTSLVIEMS
jgi:hypothetical protein